MEASNTPIPIEPLHDRIFRLVVPLPWSSPGFVNVYLIEDQDKYIMIDCGVAGEIEFNLLTNALKELGLSLIHI